MKEAKLDIWRAGEVPICILTSGSTKRDKKTGTQVAVMGKGTAADAATRFRALPMLLAANMKVRPSTNVFWFESYGLYTFKTKSIWQLDSDIEIICQSCIELMEHIERNRHSLVYLPRPGTGCGMLLWSDVRREIEDLLDDRVVVVTNGSNPMTNL